MYCVPGFAGSKDGAEKLLMEGGKVTNKLILVSQMYHKLVASSYITVYLDTQGHQQ